MHSFFMVDIFNFIRSCNMKQTLIKVPSETSCFHFGNYTATCLLVAIRILYLLKKMTFPPVLKFESPVLHMKQAKDSLWWSIKS